MEGMNKAELTILMPCLNEENTVAACVKQAGSFLDRARIAGEILVVDNGSMDASRERAVSAGARVVSCVRRGYGNALRFGIEQASGTYVIMADCDCSYSFENLQPFVDDFRDGADMVIGNRFAYPMEKGAMSFSHRYLGVPVLSFLGRCCFHNGVKDFHCGLRGVCRESFLALQCECEGMEFATEMIARAAMKKQRISQEPVRFYKDGRGHRSHLRTVRDGMRHLLLIGSLWLRRRTICCNGKQTEF